METAANVYRPGGTSGRTLRSGFLHQEATHPDAEALVVNGTSLTYAALGARARVWARCLVDHLDGPAQRVGVFGYRTEVSYTATLAALFAGAAFVPLNRTFPPARTRTMIGAADLDAIIVDHASIPQIPDVLTGCARAPLLLLPETDTVGVGARDAMVLGPEAIRACRPLEECPPVVPDEMAYLLFTSGSTGEPRGVQVTHRNVTWCLDVMLDRYGITPADRFSQTFDQTFDLSVFDLFMPWHRGACVCAMQPIDLVTPARFVRRHGVTVWFSVPSVAALMRRKNLLVPGVFPSLRWSLFCGEALPRVTAELWRAAAPHSIIENLYGPTELTIACFVHRWDPDRSPALCVNDLVPIGHPYPGLDAVVVDADLRPVRDDDTGELCVSGPQTVPGYWQDPSATAARFVELRRGASRSARFYRTGDRVRQVGTGEYAYLGRVDAQIQVLGHRVEPGEVEAAVRRQPGVVQAVVLGWPLVEGTAQALVAFITGLDADPEAVRAGVRDLLPPYMVPRDVMRLDSLPLNASGKVDRGALRRRLEPGDPGRDTLAG